MHDSARRLAPARASSRRFGKLASWLLAVGLGLAAPLTAQNGAASAAGASKESPKAEKARVYVIGASLSAGFSLLAFRGMAPGGDLRGLFERETGRKLGDFELDLRTKTLGMRRVIKALDPDKRLSVTDRSNLMLFRNPVKLGESQLKRAAKSDLVIGIDYLFWFAYGGPPWLLGQKLSERDKVAHEAYWRLEKLEKGLAFLDRYVVGKVPLIVGDLPDMRGASGMLLTKRMIPSPYMLVRLNRRIRAWAKSRRNVFVYPVAARLATLKSAQGISVADAGKQQRFASRHLMQLDNLHPNSLGVAFLFSDFCAWCNKQAPALSASLPSKADFTSVINALNLRDSVTKSLNAFAKKPEPKKAQAEQGEAKKAPTKKAAVKGK